MTGTGTTSTPAIRRALTVTAAVAALPSAVAAPAWAGPQANGHNCAGLVVSSLAGPGFGNGVSAAAQEQVVDNSGLANRDAPPRRNP